MYLFHSFFSKPLTLGFHGTLFEKRWIRPIWASCKVKITVDCQDQYQISSISLEYRQLKCDERPPLSALNPKCFDNLVRKRRHFMSALYYLDITVLKQVETQDNSAMHPLSLQLLFNCHLRDRILATRWFKYDRHYLCVNKSQFVPVIFEPPCTFGAGATEREYETISAAFLEILQWRNP
jgi:hypothetical protein